MGNKQILDLSGLVKYSKEHDKVSSAEMVVVKNVNCGKDIDKDGKAGYKFWEDEFSFSVVVPSSVALVDWTKPDMTDGGYQHPLSNDNLEDIAISVAGKRDKDFDVVWNNPRNGEGLRYGFVKLDDAKKFIVELAKNYVELRKLYEELD